MLEKVWTTITENKLILAGELVVVGVSGGPDSLALLHVLQALSPRGGFRLHAAHVNHSFRGQEADNEAAWVRETCQAWGINCTVSKIDVPSFAKKEGLSPQEAGHIARKRFFISLLRDVGGQKIALGQQADDQAETILMHLLSGAGTEGLQGIRPANFPFIRPLIFITRSEIEEYCRANSLDPRRDPSNAKNVYLRNKIRNQLLPWLKDNINPNLVANLQKTAAILQCEEDYWRGQVEFFTGQHVSRKADGVVKIKLAAFNQEAVAVQRRVIRHLCQEITSEQGPAFLHVEEIRKLALCGQVGKRLTLPGGVAVVREYQELLFSENYKEEEARGIQPQPLLIPGETLVQETGQIIKTNIVQGKPANSAYKIGLPLKDDDLPNLYYRSRQPGDWLMPLGMSGRKKLKEFFIDRKVPQQERDNALLITTGDEVIWIPGLVISNRVKGDSPIDKYLVLEISEA